MKYAITLTLLITIFATACEKLTAKEECIQEFINSKDLLRYTNQTIDSQFYFDLHEKDGEFYFLVGHHYIDFIAAPMNCLGESLCEDATSSACFDFLENSSDHGIVAISRD